MTKLGCIIEGKMAKMFRDRVNRYLEEISGKLLGFLCKAPCLMLILIAMDDNYLKEFMERAEMDCR